MFLTWHILIIFVRMCVTYVTQYIEETEPKIEVLRKNCICFISVSVSFIWLHYFGSLCVIFGTHDLQFTIFTYSFLGWEPFPNFTIIISCPHWPCLHACGLRTHVNPLIDTMGKFPLEIIDTLKYVPTSKISFSLRKQKKICRMLKTEADKNI